MLVPLLLFTSAWAPFHKQTAPGPGAVLRSTAGAIITEAASRLESGEGQGQLRQGHGWWFDLFLPDDVNATRKDWGQDLANAFENFRIPAALVAGSALTSTFTLPLLPTDSLHDGLIKRLHLLFSSASFSSSIVTVALATSALVQLNQQHSGRDSTATNFDDFMWRAGYSASLWVAVNAHFIAGIAALCIAVALRCWVTFGDDAFGRIASLIVSSGALMSISLGLPNGLRDFLVVLPLRHIRMLLNRALDLRHPAPALIAAIIMGFGSCVLAVREAVLYVLRGAQVAS